MKLQNEALLPGLFLGHGSPMNIIADNYFTKSMNQVTQKFHRPKNILVISAHWVTNGTQVLKAPKPKTIYDFGGFPEALYKIQYPSPGAPELANQLHSRYSEILTTEDWGLDHGAWSLLVHMYPEANIPVTQLSLNKNLSLKDHFRFAKNLCHLREQGTLVIASGNIVHNLRQIQWDENASTPEWAIEFDQLIKESLLKESPEDLWEVFTKHQKLSSLAHPSLEHFVPLLYTAGLKTPDEKIDFFSEGFQNGSISMRSFSTSPC